MSPTTDRTLEIVEESRMAPEMDILLRQLLVACFSPNDASFFVKSRYWHGSAPEYSVIGRVNGEIRAHVGVVVRQIRCNGTQVRIGGIQNACAHPACRGQNLGVWVLRAAMEEMPRRTVSFGMLFCLPELERYYASLGWIATREPVTMCMDGGADEPIPGKNSCMYWSPRGESLPPGPIHLQGADW